MPETRVATRFPTLPLELHSLVEDAKPKFRREVLDLRRRQGLSESIGDHISSRTVDQPNRTLLDDPTDEMISHIDMLRPRMELMVMSKCDGGLVVGEEGGRIGDHDVAEKLVDKRPKP
jgi:hypothetical protein